MTLRTIKGLFTENNQAFRTLEDLTAAGLHRDALDLLSADDASDVPKLRALSDLVRAPDLSIDLAGVRQSGTLLIAQVPANAEARDAESSVPIPRSTSASTPLPSRPAIPSCRQNRLTPSAIPTCWKWWDSARKKVETGRLRIYTVVSESNVSNTAPMCAPSERRFG